MFFDNSDNVRFDIMLVALMTLHELMNATKLFIQEHQVKFLKIDATLCN